MPRPLAPPVSFQLTTDQLTWLDTQRTHGAISRSAALRQALDQLMSLEHQFSRRPAAAAVPAQPQP